MTLRHTTCQHIPWHEITSHRTVESGYVVAEVRYKAWSDTCDDTESEAAAQLLSLVEKWCRLVHEGGWERCERHLDQVRSSLEPTPLPNRPNECALWVAALINPLPGLGVAPEIRLAALEAETAMARIALVRDAVLSSCQYMESGTLARLGVLWKRMQQLLVVTGLSWREFATLSAILAIVFFSICLPSLMDPNHGMLIPTMVAETPVVLPTPAE